MKHLPKRREATVDGQRIAYTLAGAGAPAIILINGSGGPIEGWHKLYPQIETLGIVFAYDRPGVGGSPRPVQAQTGEVVVRTLRQLLQQVGVASPYVLVGHSFGGLHANLFARLHPQETAGVVFLEATAPEDVGAMKNHQTMLQRAANGVLGLLWRPEPHGEVRHERRTIEQIAAAPPFPQVPLCVLSGGKTLPAWMVDPRAKALRDRNQQALVQLSSRGERLIAAASGHFPQLSEPALVLQAIRRVFPSGR